MLNKEDVISVTNFILLRNVRTLSSKMNIDVLQNIVTNFYGPAPYLPNLKEGLTLQKRGIETC